MSRSRRGRRNGTTSTRYPSRPSSLLLFIIFVIYLFDYYLQGGKVVEKVNDKTEVCHFQYDPAMMLMSARDVCYVKTRRDLDNGAFLLSYRSVEHEVQFHRTTSSGFVTLNHCADPSACVVCRVCRVLCCACRASCVCAVRLGSSCDQGLCAHGAAGREPHSAQARGWNPLHLHTARTSGVSLVVSCRTLSSLVCVVCSLCAPLCGRACTVVWC